MRREYRLSEAGKQRLLRRSNRMLPLFILLLVAAAFVAIGSRRGASGGPVAGTIPYVVPGVIVIALIARRRKVLARQLERYSVVLTDDEIATGGDVKATIALDRIERVEVDARGDMVLRATNGQPAIHILAELDGAEELRNELALRFGGITPRRPGASDERRTQILTAVMVGGFLATIAFDAPAVVLPSALIAFGCIVYVTVTFIRTYGMAAKLVLFMLLANIGMSIVMAAKVVKVLDTPGL